MFFFSKIIKTTLIVSLTICIQLPLKYAVAAEAETSLEGFNEIKIALGLAQSDDFIETIRPFLSGYPDGEEGNASLDLTIRKTDNGYVVNIIKKGYADDSVMGEHYRGHVIKTSKGPWELWSMGVKYLCYRGISDAGICH